ncbi:MAG: hypothetical protein PHR35_08420 [Kiritimatiellae bacterium]|nr:hypothetical protein [Kiritimatiellia bacterium]
MDLLLILVVSLQATAIAYVYDPHWKAFLLALPFPFTIASLSVGASIETSHVLGLVLLLLFTWGVKFMHYDVRLPIVPAIAVSAVAYCMLGWGLNRAIPAGEPVFWIAVAVAATTAVTVQQRLQPCAEPGNRSALPPWIKVPIIVAVVIGLLMIKTRLRGFMTVFPMVGVVAAYEARKSLRTTVQRMPAIILTLLTLMVAGHIAGYYVGLGRSLAIGWCFFLVALAVLARTLRRSRVEPCPD